MVSFSCTMCDIGLWIIIQYPHFSLITAINLDTVTKRFILDSHDVLCAMNIIKERFKHYASFECPECDFKYSYNLLVLRVLYTCGPIGSQ